MVGMITIELFGVPRLRAGIGRVPVEASDLGQALRALGRACPALEGTVVLDGRAHPAYRLCLNGDQFVSDPGMRLADGDALILLAADAVG
jgi:molybdopterin converting factor small subunit